MSSTLPYSKKKTSRQMVALTLAVALGLPFGLLAALLVLLPLSQQPMVDALIKRFVGQDAAAWPYTSLVYAGVLALVAFMVFNFGAIFGGMTTWYEMRIAGRIQSRIGPNRVGAAGFFQWVADAAKLILKEDLVPTDADAILFRAAPYFVLAGFVLTFVVLPFGESVVVADLNVGLFYVTSITALVVVGIMVAGWSSMSNWALFGGVPSAAQVVSYEIPAGLALMVPVLMAGTLSMQEIIRQQGGWPWQWFLFRNPAAFVAFVFLFTSQLAEGNRTPFDLPEADSELVAGYLSEYSGFRFALYFLVEWGNLWVISAVGVTLFFGGWQIPGVGPELWQSLRGAPTEIPDLAWWGLQALSMLVFLVKTLVLVNVIIWIRWTLPRIRVDQMMNLCWKYLVPAAFACLVFTLGWQLLVGATGGSGAGFMSVAETVSGVALFAIACLLLFRFLVLTRKNIDAVVGDRIDLTNW